MKAVCAVFIFCLSAADCISQAGEWTWMHGDTVNSGGNFGTQGVSNASNNPPPLYEPCEWTDLNGNFWLYGGLRGGCNGFCVYNDLWKYDPIINEWTWMKGTGIPNDSIGNFGIRGIASATNQPPCLSWGAQSWVDLNGNLWMFGGEDNNTVTSDQGWNALWKYTITTNQWTWMNGPSVPDQPGVYGIIGVPDTADYPSPSTENALSWTGNSGDLYLLEGNALWRYSISANTWTWIKGSQNPQPEIFGIMGLEDSLNSASGDAFSRWKDHFGNFWFFDSHGLMWRYNPQTNNWAWMNGDTTANLYCYRVYGNKCVPSPLNAPGSRHENRAAWVDNNGNFWMFGGWMYGCGGGALSDLWMYDVSSNQWTWANDDSSFIVNSNASYGTPGVSSPTNDPGFKEGAVAWSDNNGHLFLYSGLGIGASWYSSALWKYTIDTSCATVGTNEINSVHPELQIYPNPVTGELTIIIHGQTIQKTDFIVFNVLGEKVFSATENFISGSFTKKINIINLARGIYFLQINMDGENVTRKIEKE